MNPLQINIDASSLSSAGCMLNFKRVAIDGYREKVSGSALIYGSAIHKFIDTMYKTGGHLGKALAEGKEVFNKPKMSSSSTYLDDERHFVATCYNTWHDFIAKDEEFQTLMLPNGVPATEVTFSFPYYASPHLEVRLCGTIDRIGKIKNGVFAIRDFKTTSKYNVKEYLDSYRLSRQLRFYVLALQLMAEREPDSMLGQIGKQAVGCVIDGIFLKAKASDNIYQSSPVFMFGEDTMSKFRLMLDLFIDRLSYAVKHDSFYPEGILNGSCKGEYKCKFAPVCGAPSQVHEVMLSNNFIQVNYNPLKFGETL